LAIFNHHSPLHDGGVIIYNNKIVSARSILPVTERQDLPPQFGLRHRAAIGMTEVTDTLVLVVSEETGQISVAKNGILESNLSIQETRAVINDYLQGKHKS
jgi:DNA integrity scanning protein DisA with diadenylate cyclase activity